LIDIKVRPAAVGRRYPWRWLVPSDVVQTGAGTLRFWETVEIQWGNRAMAVIGGVLR